MKKKCLIFGGNGFIGFEMLLTLMKDPDSSSLLELALVHRGKSWDWEKKRILRDAVGCLSRCFTVNRNNPLSHFTEFTDFVKSVDRFDCVIDFSGYRKFAVEQAVDLLWGKVGLYIYISTDSVYEVCDLARRSQPIQEDAAVLPSCPQRRRLLGKKDPYGRKKLQCEEVLKKAQQNKGLTFVILRLADIVGYRDCTNRWLEYQLWVQLSDALHIPVFIPHNLEAQPISLVFSEDIANLLKHIILNDAIRQLAMGEIFNLAFTDCPTLLVRDVINAMSSALHLKGVSVASTSKNAPVMYPSVECGAIDTSKAASLLGWSPTPSTVAFTTIAEQYDASIKCGDHSRELWEAADELLSDIRDLYDSHTLSLAETKLREWIGRENTWFMLLCSWLFFVTSIKALVALWSDYKSSSSSHDNIPPKSMSQHVGRVVRIAFEYDFHRTQLAAAANWSNGQKNYLYMAGYLSSVDGNLSSSKKVCTSFNYYSIVLHLGDSPVTSSRKIRVTDYNFHTY